MKDPDRSADDIGVVDKLGVAEGIEWNVSSRRNSAVIPNAVKAFHGRIEGDRAAARESHDCDASGIDPRVLGQNAKSLVYIDDHVQQTELRLFRYQICDGGSGKTV